LVVVNEFVIAPLSPAARCLINLAGKDAHSSRDGDVDGVEIDCDGDGFPVDARSRGPGISEPVELISSSISSRVSSFSGWPPVSVQSASMKKCDVLHIQYWAPSEQ